MPPRPWDPDAWVADPARLRMTLDWSPSGLITEGFERPLEWFYLNRVATLLTCQE